ncbi:glycosyltransferase family 2 protein [Flavobacterium sp. XS2P39]|uniref:glycosyltransferase family 2 protein n=1 Tax=Flavobacterium sp. XS2P39 TaxID=3401725 RepID=UPI003AAD69D7
MGNTLSELKISVLMSVWNGERFLHQAIDSILNQSYNNFEFIIINDGSFDDSEKIILSYKDPRVVYLKNDINIGLAASLNKGIQIAKGKYIARMDDDDLSHKDRFKIQLEFLENNPNIGVLGTIAKYITEENEYITTTALPENDKEIKKKLPLFWFHHGSVVIRKEFLIECGGYDSWCKRIEDLLLWNKLSYLTDFHVIQEPLYTWRLTVKGATNVPLSKDVKLLLNKFKTVSTIDEAIAEIKVYDMKADIDQKNSPNSTVRQYQYYKKIIGYSLGSRNFNVVLKYYYKLLRYHFRIDDAFLIPLKIIKKIIK